MCSFKAANLVTCAYTIGYLMYMYTAVLTVTGSDVNVYFTATHGSRLPGDGTEVAGPRDAVYCCRRCKTLDDCTAVNFNTMTKTCELILNNETLLSLELTHSPDWSLYLTHSTDPRVGANASQSSTSFNGFASNAINGITSGDYVANACTHTHAVDPDPWWRVELAAPRRITGLRLWNRLDTGGQFTYRLRNLTIYVSSTTGGLDYDSNVCGHYLGPPGGINDNPITVICFREMVGRYIKIHKTISEYLTLCEVQILTA